MVSVSLLLISYAEYLIWQCKGTWKIEYHSIGTSAWNLKRIPSFLPSLVSSRWWLISFKCVTSVCSEARAGKKQSVLSTDVCFLSSAFSCLKHVPLREQITFLANQTGLMNQPLDSDLISSRGPRLESHCFAENHARLFAGASCKIHVRYSRHWVRNRDACSQCCS